MYSKFENFVEYSSKKLHYNNLDLICLYACYLTVFFFNAKININCRIELLLQNGRYRIDFDGISNRQLLVSSQLADY